MRLGTCHPRGGRHSSADAEMYTPMGVFDRTILSWPLSIVIWSSNSVAPNVPARLVAPVRSGAVTTGRRSTTDRLTTGASPAALLGVFVEEVREEPIGERERQERPQNVEDEVLEGVLRAVGD